MAFEVEALLRDIAPDAPSGEDLTYDAAYLELGRLVQGRPEQQVGDTIVEAEEANWREVENNALALLARTRDLRVILNLIAAALAQRGPQGLRDGLTLLVETLKQHWASVYPLLDPDDGNDPLERMNIISSLSTAPGTTGDPLNFRKRALDMPLVRSRQLGGVSLRQAQRAAAGEGVPEGQPDSSMTAAIVQDADLDEMTATREALATSIECMKQIDQSLMELVGAGSAPNLDGLRNDLEAALAQMTGWLAQRGVGSVEDADASAGGGGGGGAPARLTGDITSAQDALTAIDKIIRFYQQQEPSSPVPFMLETVKALVSKPFLELSKRLPPDTVRTIARVAEPPSD